MAKSQSVLDMIKTMSQEEFENWDDSDEKGLVGADIAGVAEAADLFGVTKQVIVNWRTRSSTFPKPYTVLAIGPIYLKSDLVAWGKATGKL